MTYDVMVEHRADGYRATPFGFPDVAVTAPTRQEALQAVAGAIAERLAEVEIAQVEVPTAPRGSLAAIAGLFADDPGLARQICDEAYAARDAEPLGAE